MKRIAILTVLAGVTLGMAGCGQYGNEPMAGAAVDIPDDPPLSEQPPVITAPSPSPAGNGPLAPAR